MKIERINPDFEWTRYRNITAVEDAASVSFPQRYKAPYASSTAHRRLSKAYADNAVSPLAHAHKEAGFVIAHWLGDYGFLTTEFRNESSATPYVLSASSEKSAGDILTTGKGVFEFDQVRNPLLFEHFFSTAGEVWWTVQVLAALRNTEHDGKIGLNPKEITRLASKSINVTIPNPERVLNPRFPTSGGAREFNNSDFLEPDRSADTWTINYLDVLSFVSDLIRTRLEGRVDLAFENSQYPNNFADSPRDREGSLQGTKRDSAGNFLETRSDTDTHKVQGVLQPKDLTAFIWLLLAEDFEEIPNFEYDNCNGYDDREIEDADGRTRTVLGCGNVLKRRRVRACLHCNAMVSVHDLDSEECPKNGLHSHRKHQRSWCSLSCRSRFQKRPLRV